MSSSVDISFDVVQRFNLTPNEIKQLVYRLSETVEESKGDLTEDQVYINRIEKKLKQQLFS